MFWLAQTIFRKEPKFVEEIDVPEFIAEDELEPLDKLDDAISSLTITSVPTVDQIAQTDISDPASKTCSYLDAGMPVWLRIANYRNVEAEIKRRRKPPEPSIEPPTEPPGVASQQPAREVSGGISSGRVVNTAPAKEGPKRVLVEEELDDVPEEAKRLLQSFL